MKEKTNTLVQAGKDIVLFIKHNLAATIVTLLLAFIVDAVYLGFRYVMILLDNMIVEINDIKNEVVTDESTAYTESVTMAQNVNVLLDELVTINQACRAKIWMFHNGKKSLNGVNFVYAEAISERTARGVQGTVLNYNQIPASIFSEFAPYFDKPIWTCMSKDEVSDNTLRSFYEDQGIAMTCVHPLRENGRTFGFVSVSYGSIDKAILAQEEQTSDVYLENIKIAGKIESLFAGH